MQILDALDEYRYAVLQLGEETQAWYSKRLRRFGLWCVEQELELEQLKPLHIAKYLYDLATIPSQATGKQLSSYTVHGHARCIRVFLFWCAKEPQEYVSLNVPTHLAMPKVKKKVIETFSDLQIKSFFAACESERTSVLVARDKAILALLLDTGIRAAELCGLELKDIYITARDGYIRVTGKGDKEREVGLGRKSRQYLEAWIKRYRKAPADEQHVFLGHKRFPMTPNGLNQLIRRLARYGKVSGVRASPHTFRHTFACNFLMQGGDLFVLSRLLGHTSVQVTEMYLRAVKSADARKTSKSVLDNL